ncbi:alanyl (membrane) aminopeptidase-like b [Odontesthes bonariensis]|uniref:alanyl (membrane) aminopeptidase-like b n=1 Tax=Odontesthes bonariensis TaxID=219752 RepID=UPI003F580F8D
MPENSGVAKVFASAFAVLTVSAIAGLVTMIVVYKIEIDQMNPTPRPTYPSTTLSPPPVTRLPKNLVPQTYEIFLQPHLYSRIISEVNVTSPNQTMLFTGNSTLHFHCVQKTGHIFLNSKDLVISSPRVFNKDTNEGIGVNSWKHHEDETDFLEIELNGFLEAGGNYSLFLAFKGEISENLEALYVSTYTEGSPDYEVDTDADRFLAATNLEPTDARKLFPCLDEPEMKAVFYVTIIHRRDTIALGNAARTVSNVIDDEWKYTRFQPTPAMSTYLFAFVVSEFKSVESPHRVKIRTYARPEAIDAGHAKYAANITGKILTYFEKQFDIDYELGKLEQVAVPDLISLAMENWGLVTYQEGALLYEEGVSSLLHKELIASTIAHELAHQWFGNLVTMKWWTELWLKEGFATYLAPFAVDDVEPTFKMKDTLVMYELHSAFEEDALESSHPLSAPPEDVETTSEVLGMFDAISYSKGAMVLRMLANVVTERAFNSGLRRYLETFRKGNADQDDLWELIQLARHDKTGLSVAKLMDPWTKQKGYPVITIDTNDGEIYQKQFLFNDTAESSLWWPIPIRLKSNNSDTTLVWLDETGPVKKEEFISKKDEWILANVNCYGYYRVNYNPENWQRLLTQLETNPDGIPLMNRGQLVDDAFNLARAKLIDVTLALNATRFLSKEREYLPWESAERNIKYFMLMFDRTEVYGPMQLYLQEKVRGLYDFFRNHTDQSRVPDDHSLQHNQIIAIQLACSNGLPECTEMAKEKFADWMNSNSTNSIHANLRSVIYCQAVAAGGKKEWEFAWEKFQSSTDPSEKDQLRYALSCTKKTWLLNRYLEYTLNPEKIRLMDVASTINNIAENVAGHLLAWSFIRANWDYVSQGDAASLIEGVTSRFSTQFELEELEYFAQSKEMHGAFRAVELAIEQTQVNIQWVSDNKAAILEWFEGETAHLE